MRPAAFALLLASACLAAAGAAEPAVRRIGAVDYVSVEDGADRLGLRLVPLVAQSAVILKDGARPVARPIGRDRTLGYEGEGATRRAAPNRLCEGKR